MSANFAIEQLGCFPIVLVPAQPLYHIKLTVRFLLQEFFVLGQIKRCSGKYLLLKAYQKGGTQDPGPGWNTRPGTVRLGPGTPKYSCGTQVLGHLKWDPKPWTLFLFYFTINFLPHAHHYIITCPLCRTRYFICRYPAGIYLLKVNNRNTRARCEICSKLTINVLVFLLLTLNMQLPAGYKIPCVKQKVTAIFQR